MTAARRVSALVLTALALAACSMAPPPNANLAAADAVVTLAANDRAVARAAPVELKQAQDALEAAERVWRSGGDPLEVDHDAYLAARRAELAIEATKLKLARATVVRADAPRNAALLTARAQDADRERAQALDAWSQAQAQALQHQLAELRGGGATEPMLTLGDSLFELNGAALRPAASDGIRQIASFLKEHPERTALVEGFTDSGGGADANARLAERRAQAVRDALVAEGVAPQRLVARGRGDAEPAASNDTAAGRQLNRRVRIAISGAAPAVGSSAPPAVPSVR